MSSTAPSPFGLRSQPYRLFFPLAILLAWAGIGHWVTFSLGWSTTYRSVFHSIAQIQGFMTCFAVGFLMTAIPRRTGTPPPSATQITIGAVAPVATTMLAWFEEFAWSQIPWMVMCVMLLVFAVRRFRASDAKRRPPMCFVWIPIAMLFAFAGVVALALFGALGLDYRVHQFGRLLVLQGIFLALVIGVGGMILPLVTRGESSTDATDEDFPKLLVHLASAFALVCTFVLEVFGLLALAYAIRAVLVGILLLAEAGIHRRPTRSGWHRWLVWLAAWAIPIGYAWGAIMAPLVQVGLHTVFIAGFAMMALAVGLHVSLAHGDRQELVHRTPWQVPLLALLVLAACVTRMFVNLDSESVELWIGVSSGLFLAATLAWLSLALGPILRRRVA